MSYDVLTSEKSDEGKNLMWFTMNLRDRKQMNRFKITSHGTFGPCLTEGLIKNEGWVNSIEISK